MNARDVAGRLLSGLVLPAVLVGCASSAASMSPAPSSTPAITPAAAAATPSPMGTPSASTSPTPTPTQPAIAYGPVTVVTGIGTCPVLDPTWTTDPDGTAHVRDSAVVCHEELNDPRVSGTHTATWNMDLWADEAGVQWGTVRLENAGGAWEGRLTGVNSDARGDTIMVWYMGTGGYEGLSYFELWSGQEPWTIQGQIFPGDPPIP